MTHGAIPVRHIRHHHRRLVELHGVDVTDDTDNLLFLPGSPVRQTGTADRVLPRPEMLGHALGNHNHVATAIALIEDSAAQERNADGPEIVGAPGAEIPRVVRRAPGRYINSTARPFALERPLASPTHSPHPW